MRALPALATALAAGLVLAAATCPATAQRMTAVFSRNATTYEVEAGRYGSLVLAQHAADGLSRSRYDVSVEPVDAGDGEREYAVLVRLAGNKRTLPTDTAVQGRQALRAEAERALSMAQRSSPADGRVYLVQTAACLLDASAADAALRLEAAGYDPAVALLPDAKGNRWRVVHLGPFPDRPSAEAAMRRYTAGRSADALVRSVESSTYEGALIPR